MTTITFYGTRGSSAYDSLENRVFGGNTACVLVRTRQNDVLLLDAGTGLLAAEKEILENRPRNLSLALSHAHHDHIEGIGISALAYIPGMEMKIIADKKIFKGLKQRYNQSNFPVPFCEERMKGIDFSLLEPEEKSKNPECVVEQEKKIEQGIGQGIELGVKLAEDMALQALHIGSHPGGVLAYRIRIGEKVLVYATDHEFSYGTESYGPDETAAMQNKNPRTIWLDDAMTERYIPAVKHADILIADAQFTAEEYASGKFHGWGHSYPEQILGMAAEAGVKKVILTHHAPRRTDEQLFAMERSAQQCVQQQGYQLTVGFAKQGESYEL